MTFFIDILSFISHITCPLFTSYNWYILQLLQFMNENFLPKYNLSELFVSFLISWLGVIIYKFFLSYFFFSEGSVNGNKKSTMNLNTGPLEIISIHLKQMYVLCGQNSIVYERTIRWHCMNINHVTFDMQKVNIFLTWTNYIRFSAILTICNEFQCKCSYI